MVLLVLRAAEQRGTDVTATVSQLHAERFGGTTATFGESWRCRVAECRDRATLQLALGGERRLVCEAHAGVVAWGMAGVAGGEVRLSVRRLS
jgi:hypothetical protein